MSYTKEELGISLFENTSSKPKMINPEDLLEEDLTFNSSKSYNKITVKSMVNDIIRDSLVTGVLSKGSSDTIVVIELEDGAIMSHPDRLFLMMDGSYRSAGELTRSDKLRGITTSVNIKDVTEIPLIDKIYSFDLVTDPDCGNILLSSGVFAGNVTKGVSEGSETLSL